MSTHYHDPVLLEDAGSVDVVTEIRREAALLKTGALRNVILNSANSIARSMAGNQVVANQIVVVPAGGERDAKAVSSDLDQGIEKNLDAALIQNNLRKNVKFSVKSGVVTLTGEVNSQSRRARAEGIASPVPNVQQVVNELQVKDQKATSSN